MGLRSAASAVSSKSQDYAIRNPEMAPALTEPVNHRQTKLSSPAQASSPRPIISDINEQTQTTSNPHHRLAAQTNGGILSVDSCPDLKETNQLEQLAATEQQVSTVALNKAAASQIPNFQSAFEQHLALANGPSVGPSFLTHMDQPNTTEQQNVIDFTEQSTPRAQPPQPPPQQPQQQQQQQQQQEQEQQQQQQLQTQPHEQQHHQSYQAHQHHHEPHAVDLLDSIVNTSNPDCSSTIANQMDCSNLNDNEIQTTVEQLLAQTQTEEFQHQFQQEFLHQQQQHQNQNQLDQQIDFAIQQHQQNELSQFQAATQDLSTDQLLDVQSLQTQSMHLLMDDSAVPSAPCDSSGNVNVFGGNGLNGTSQMQSNFLKENAEMEKMLGELAASDNDFMQLFLEATPAGENLGDLAGGLSLFNDVDVMNIGLDDVVSGSQTKEVRPQELLAEIEKKRERMIRDCDFMMRRLRKIQARHMGRHVSEEVCGLYEYTQQMIKRKERETKSISTMTPINQLHSEKSKLTTAASWKTLLRRIEHAATSQQANTAAGKLLAAPNAHGDGVSTAGTATTSSGAAATASGSKSTLVICAPPFDTNGTQQLKQMAGLLSAELKIVSASFDSDATASSSGGESADEGITYNNVTQKPLTIAKRAGYRWARDRAKIASRWTWLLAQISELEYRIRQHQEQYILLKQRNGSVKFDDSEPINSAGTSSGEPQTHTVNGYRGTLPGSLSTSGDPFADSMKAFGTNDDVELNGSARTRAFKPDEFNKRKLLQSTNLHKISRRAARSCTIKCGCRWPVHPCLLCTGRVDPTAPRDLPDMLSTQESVALLDPCFHPILSFPEDVSQTIYMEATLRQPEWQAKVARASSKAIKGALAQQKAAADDMADSTTTTSPTGRKNSASANLSINSKKSTSKKFKMLLTKLKKSRHGNNNNNTTTSRKLKKAAQAHLTKSRKNNSRKNSTMSATSTEQHDIDISSPNGSISRSKNPSPTPHGPYRIISDRRHNKNAYDIDNIVIPSNMTSRVEILSYKEIPTPKWRLIEDDGKPVETASQQKPEPEPEEMPEMSEMPETSSATEKPRSPSPLPSLQPPPPPPTPPTSIEPTSIDPTPIDHTSADPDEDISNEAYMQRHERALAEEKKKFITFLKFPYSTRSRANRRIDSQADSSGANTPDPMSPAPATPAPAVNADQESAPPTPQSVDPNSETTTDTAKPNNNNNNGGIANPLPPAPPKNERRRTVSFKKTADPLELLRRSTTPDVKDTIPPYEPLNFPLANDTLEQMIQCMPNEYKDIINECIDQMTGVVKHSTDAVVKNAVANETATTAAGVSDVDIVSKAEAFSPLPMLAEDSDETESVHEDPNDPEWFEPPQRIPRLQ